jgi:hypothetical protein
MHMQQISTIKRLLKNPADGGNAVPPITKIDLFKIWEGRDSFPTVLLGKFFNSLLMGDPRSDEAA